MTAIAARPKMAVTRCFGRLGNLDVTLLITVLVLGMLGSLSPSTIVVFILLLASTRARVNAAAFLVGWSVSLVAVFAFAYLAGGAHSLRHGSGHTTIEIVEVLLGLGLIGVGARHWRRRRRPRPPTKGFVKDITGHLKDVSPIEATLVGVLEQPWTLTAAAAVIVVRHHSAVIVVVAAFLLFTLASTATVGLSYLYYARRPREAEAHLSALRVRVVAAGPALVAAVSVAVGVFLVADGVVGLLGS